MKRLVSTLNLPKEDWLRYRKCGITGTDAGAILGLNPYRSAFQVYHDKISDTIENIDNEAMRQGRDLEDYVAQRSPKKRVLRRAVQTLSTRARNIRCFWQTLTV